LSRFDFKQIVSVDTSLEIMELRTRFKEGNERGRKGTLGVFGGGFGTDGRDNCEDRVLSPLPSHCLRGQRTHAVLCPGDRRTEAVRTMTKDGHWKQPEPGVLAM
jgi:hypothetical protein